MKYLLVLSLALIPVKSYAFGWFLLGMAIGSSDSTETTYTTPSATNAFIEVQNCRGKERLIIRSSIVIGFVEETRKSSKYVRVKTAQGYNDYCLYGYTLDRVKTKFFPSPQEQQIQPAAKQKKDIYDTSGDYE